MNAAQFRVLHILVHTCLMCADILQITGKFPRENFVAICATHITSDFAKLRSLLGLSREDACSIMHIIIRKLCDSVSQFTAGSLTSEEARNSWEERFCINIKMVGLCQTLWLLWDICNPVFAAKHQILVEYHAQISGLKTASSLFEKGLLETSGMCWYYLVCTHFFKTILLELTKEEKAAYLPRLFRFSSMRNFSTFRADFTANPTLSKVYVINFPISCEVTPNFRHPFLAAFFVYEEELQLIKNLLPLVAWTSIYNFILNSFPSLKNFIWHTSYFVTSKLSHRINRKDAQTLTIKSFLERETVTQNAKMFEKFAKAWNSI